MIKYKDGEPIDLLPSHFKENADAVAISYACKMAIASLLECQKLTHLYSDIDSMPEELLDLMALEMKAPYYSENLEISIKRKLVKNAILWRSRAGTKKSVQDLITTIFGEGEIIEWYDFEDGPGTPGVFDIITPVPLTEESFNQVSQIIDQVKNASSHIRYLSARHQVEKEWTAKFGRTVNNRMAVTNDVNIDDPDQALFMDQFYALAEDSYFTSDEVLDVPDYSQNENTTRYAAMGIVQHSCQDIGGVNGTI